MAPERVKFIEKFLGVIAKIHGRNFEILNYNRNKETGTNCSYLAILVDGLGVKNGEERGRPVSYMFYLGDWLIVRPETEIQTLPSVLGLFLR